MFDAKTVVAIQLNIFTKSQADARMIGWSGCIILTTTMYANEEDVLYGE